MAVIANMPIPIGLVNFLLTPTCWKRLLGQNRENFNRKRRNKKLTTKLTKAVLKMAPGSIRKIIQVIRNPDGTDFQHEGDHI
jgi:hypothetical protein